MTNVYDTFSFLVMSARIPATSALSACLEGNEKPLMVKGSGAGFGPGLGRDIAVDGAMGSWVKKRSR